MEYVIGLFLSLAVAGLATITGLDRERAFYPTVMIVIASYYVLFAVMAPSGRALVIEIVVASAFLLFANQKKRDNHLQPARAIQPLCFALQQIVEFVDKPGKCVSVILRRNLGTQSKHSSLFAFDIAFAGYLLGRVTTHKCLLRTGHKKRSLSQEGESEQL